ncbi:MAG: DEAD/DEAH box helicase family protein [Chloroflexi bacterium]|nr:DEAD/DEAH box helicase family protein [Chloroflexota bacterium]
MHGELVAIDLETTGLSFTDDEIIEIGAVRFAGETVLEEFSTLVDPQRPIPDIVAQLTGIRSDDVVGAPLIRQVLPQLLEFVGDRPWMAHNITFDAHFLGRYGALTNNLRIDTYDLASVLLPQAPRYNLTSLTQQIGINIESAHRALYDARATASIYWMLWQKALALPYATLHEIAEMARDLAWDAKPVFEAAWREHPDRQVTVAAPALHDLFASPPTDRPPLVPNLTRTQLTPEDFTAVFGDDGALKQKQPDYEPRPQQLEMAQGIAQGFNTAQHVMIEAGTGTGKSLAYLTTALLWALKNHERVVVSTYTLNLQDQLIQKDIPALQAALDQPYSEAVVAVMKGRANYLCPRRLETARRQRPSNVDELRTLAKIMVWLLESSSGDKSEISLRGSEENVVWQRLSSEDEECTLERCHNAMGGACPFYKARKAADAAHLLVVNHALLLTDAAADSQVLPDYRYLIVDEAHHLEAALTSSLSFRLDETTLRRRLNDLGGPERGLLGELLRSVRLKAPDKDVQRLDAYISMIGEATHAMGVHVASLFKALQGLLAELNVSRTDYQAQVRIHAQTRSKSSFAQLQTVWATLQEFFEVVGQAMTKVTKALKRLESYQISGYDDLINGAATAARHLDTIRRQLAGFILAPEPNTIYWLSVNTNWSQLTIHSAPLHIGPLAEAHLWQAKESVALTSATLQINGSFDFIKERLHADQVQAVDVGSPFNYRDSTLIFTPDDLPDPNDRNRYQQAVERAFIELAAALNGRVLGLFTSFSHLRQTAQAITPRLALGNISVYDQSDGSSRQALLEGFKADEKAVLLGTRSFWEGIVIPGESLSGLVIVRLPFATPTDPVFAARSETYPDSFQDYTLPDAILRFRQGFGRLIRSSTDRGVVVILDGRVLTKRYGPNFINALPESTVYSGPLATLADVAVRWLKNDKT